jgi:hypothetical protein
MSPISYHHCGKSITAKRIRFAASGRETQKILLHDFEVAICLLCSVAVTKNKMASSQQQEQVVVWHTEMKSFIEVQRNY